MTKALRPVDPPVSPAQIAEALERRFRLGFALGAWASGLSVALYVVIALLAGWGPLWFLGAAGPLMVFGVYLGWMERGRKWLRNTRLPPSSQDPQ